MTDTYQQPPAQRCVKSMKKSGKLAVALAGILLGALLLFFGNRAGRDTSDTAPTAPPETSVPSAETYRAELESRVKSLCSRVVGVGEVEQVRYLEQTAARIHAPPCPKQFVGYSA